jgi:hypothetical protein
LVSIVDGRESSKDDRGARKGEDDLDAREAVVPPPPASLDLGVVDVVEYGSLDDDDGAVPSSSFPNNESNDDPGTVRLANGREEG